MIKNGILVPLLLCARVQCTVYKRGQEHYPLYIEGSQMDLEFKVKSSSPFCYCFFFSNARGYDCWYYCFSIHVTSSVKCRHKRGVENNLNWLRGCFIDMLIFVSVSNWEQTDGFGFQMFTSLKWELGSSDDELYEVLISSQCIPCSRWPSAQHLCGEAVHCTAERHCQQGVF